MSSWLEGIYPKLRKHRSSLPNHISDGLEMFAVANAIFMTGMFFSNQIPAFLLQYSFTDIDLVIFSVLGIYLLLLMDFRLIGFMILGWILAAIYMRLRNPNISLSSYFYAVGFIPGYIFIFFSLVILNISLGSWMAGGGLGFLLTIPLLLWSLTGIYVAIMVMGMPAYMILLYTNPKVKHTESVSADIKDMLKSRKPQLPTSVCPFKDVRYNGCSFLGYPAGNYPLICDHEEEYRGCSIYNHLYYKRLEVIKDLKE